MANETEDTEELERRLDRVACRPRLYPARVWALQIVCETKLDALIEERILSPIAEAAKEALPPQPFRFSVETLLDEPALPRTWREQFVSDFRVFGLREAIVYMAQYELAAEARPVVDEAVAVYHAIASAWRKNAARVARSTDPVVHRLLRAVVLFGEGRPQRLRTERSRPRRTRRQRRSRKSR